MVDNSFSMLDRQELLAEAVSRLLDQLAAPTTGTPVTDLHIGVITSSLGGHGADQCSKTYGASNPTQYDNAHLLPTVRPLANLVDYNDLGFLWWDPLNEAGGESKIADLRSQFTEHVLAAGEIGCGYEASLEAWYRFLVDPSPPEDVVVENGTAVVKGVDAVVLQQRHDFLRADSAVVVIMLSDENDCSIIDGGINWMSAQTSNPNNTAFHLPRATKACATNPNSACCRSCASSESAPPAGCTSLTGDPECQKGPLGDVGDHPYLRCWDQKRRFGYDFLYPTRKYAEALTQPTVCASWSDGTKHGECAGERVPNPLFAGGRDPRLVFLVGIVGVPWQDLATEATLGSNDLALMDANEILAGGRWSWLVPSCLEPVSELELPRPMSICKRWNLADQPDDPFMIESTQPRSGTNPATGTPTADPGAAVMASPINGHEWNTADFDLQYACISQLATPHDCSMPSISGCDCDDVGGAYTANNPVCQGSSGYTPQQLYTRAYPGTRHLEVLRDIGPQAVVASICAKSVVDASSSGYGYNAAMDAVLQKLTPVLK